MSATDAMLARYQAELEEKRTLMDGLVEGAESAGRDMTEEENGLYVRARDRMRVVASQMEPLQEGARIAIESRTRTQELMGLYANARNPQAANVEYRSAGAYVADRYYSMLGDKDATERIEIFNRVAAHQTTPDNPGLLPESIVSPLLNFIESTRPVVSSIGTVDPGTGSWAYATVTQHTTVGLQAGEKTELASQKMLITKTPLAGDLWGGYVNVSKQDIQRTSPGILDMVISDLAAQYAKATENVAADALTTAATAGPVLPTGTPTAAQIAGAVYAAAGSVYAATGGQGQTVVAVSPDMLGLIGPVFPPVNPQNGYGSGFTAATFGAGSVGSVSGLPVIMSAGLNAGSIVVYSTAAAKAFEHNYGNLQVVEPSVWGVQVGYAGEFDFVVVLPAGVIKITKTP